MKTVRGIGLWSVISLALIALAGNVQGSLRPCGDAGSLSEVQGVFDGIGSSIDAVNDQTTEALFEPTGAGNSVASFVASVSWGSTAFDIEFGIYDLNDPSQRVAMFNWANAPTPGATVVLDFDQDNNQVRSVDLDNIALYDQSDYYFKDFGFYVTSDFGGGTFFSDDSLNGGYARILTYEGKGDDVVIDPPATYNDIGHWYVATEAGNYTSIGGDTSTADFSDMIVQMESITPIPEPSSIAMIGLVSGSALFIRKRFII